jgi:L-ascorbate metabolism protein UlaG (beta-lactamase superfamily)
MKAFIKWSLILLASVILFIILAAMIVPKIAPPFGKRPSGEHLERISLSPNHQEGKFQNLLETPMNFSGDSILSTFMKFVRGVEGGTPEDVIETADFHAGKYQESADSLLVTWFGHSTILLRIGEKNLLIDPVFCGYAAPYSFLGPNAFPYSRDFSPDDLPPLDAVVISHDHYDHLDYETMGKLKDRAGHFFVPLGVSAHLMRWGIPPEKITELDWWEEARYENILLACVPMRHFSGRGITDRFTTLWGGWVIRSGDHSVIHTGDSGYGPHFREIGERYGPFDLTMVECGQYNENWRYIHMMPEQTVQAHLDLKGRLLMPIHWGKFKLALHPWTEPVERAGKEARARNVKMLTPLAGQTFTLAPPLPESEWWQQW